MPNHEELAARYLTIFNDNFELHDIRYTKMRAEANATDIEEGGMSPEFSLRVATSEEGESEEGWRLASVAISVHVEVEMGELSVEAEAYYRFPESIVESVNPIGLVTLANDSTFRILLPYLREGVQDLAGKVFRVQIVMPEFSAGEIEFRVPTERDMENLGFVSDGDGYRFQRGEDKEYLDHAPK